jgi:hypothetical protein
MTRIALEHLLRAAGAITNEPEWIVIGSQAILGQFPDAPDELLISREADLVPRFNPELSDIIDGALGEGSPFDTTFNYHAHGVDYATAILPNNWQDRLVLIDNPNTNHIKGWCLEVHDLAISKLLAGREKDLDFIAALFRHRLVSLPELQTRLAATLTTPAQQTQAQSRLQRLSRTA